MIRGNGACLALKLILNLVSFRRFFPFGIVSLVGSVGIDTFAKTAVVCGRSKNVGMPMAMLLHTDHRHERPGGKRFVAIADLSSYNISRSIVPAPSNYDKFCFISSSNF